MRGWIAPVLLVLGVAGCALPGAAPPPSGVRPDLDRRWNDAAGGLRWPARDGFDRRPVPVVLQPGMLLDRFGSDTGNFFSPKGAAFGGRALPYACAARPYTAYEVLRPVVAWTGTAAPWFDEPGGATQFKTDASAGWLVADGTLRPLPPRGPAPCPAGG